MTLRATTHEQFRIVLKWVKEHPVLARNDNECEKGGREIKNKLWEKLSIELNEIGPPIRTWMGWKRVLTDYKYSLKKKIQRRIANTSQGGTEILASLSELETEALQASLLDWDYSDPEKMLSDTPPVDDSQKSPDEMLAGSNDSMQRNESVSMNGSSENLDSSGFNTLPPLNGSNLAAIPYEHLEIKMETDDDVSDQTIPNGNVHTLTPNTSQNNAHEIRSGDNLTPLQTVAAEDLTLNGESRVKVEEPPPQEMLQVITTQGQTVNSQSEVHPPTAPVYANAQETASILQSIFNSNPVQATATPIELSEASNILMLPQQQQQGMLQQQLAQPIAQQLPAPQQSILQQQQQQQQLEQLAGTQCQVTIKQSPLYAETSQLPQQLQMQLQSQPQQALTTEAMNTLIAREIDRMALAQKSKKTTQRKRETRDKTRNSQDNSQRSNQDNGSQDAPKLQKERSRKATTSSEPMDRVKKVAPKRPRPKPKDTTTKDTKEPPKDPKRCLNNRQFRECLLRLLTEANEMEKRRIAITETKVRNQTEIQNLEITRMNLEIMKLQKEITLLDHGAKILP